MKLVLLLTLWMLFAAACEPAGYTNTGFNADVAGFLSQQGLAPTDLKCSLLGTGVTRGPDGMCMLTMTDVDVAALVSSLGLQMKKDIFVSWQPTGADCWTRLEFHDPNYSQWYITPDDGPHLKAANGAEFSYFRLFYDQDTATACISISYPKGI